MPSGPRQLRGPCEMMVAVGQVIKSRNLWNAKGAWRMPKVAVIQKPPVMLDRAMTISRVLESIEEAARAGASLLVFPEAYIPGYPTWIWRLKPGGDMTLSS